MNIEILQWEECPASGQLVAEAPGGSYWITGEGDSEDLTFYHQGGISESVVSGIGVDYCKTAANIHNAKREVIDEIKRMRS